MLGVVAHRELEDGAAGPGREPGHGAHREGLGPGHLVHQPRGGHPGERGGRGGVQVERGRRVPLEEGGRDGGVHLALHGAAHDLRLVLARGEDRDLPGLEDRGDPHRERLPGDVRLAEEVGRGVPPGDGVEGDEPRAAAGAGAGLVEPDVAGLPDAEELEVDPACGPDGGLVRLGVGREGLAGHGAVGDVDVGRVEVHLPDEVLLHEPAVGVQAGRVHRPVLVEVEGDDVAEGEPLLAVHPHQLAVHPDRRGTGGQAEDGAARPGADDLRDAPRHGPLERRVVVEHDRGDALEPRGVAHRLTRGSGRSRARSA